MELVYQQNNSQCVAAVASMVLGITLEEVCAFCGHDGTQQVFPDLGTAGTRGFHHQEIVALALTTGHAMTEIEMLPNSYYPSIEEDGTLAGKGGVWMIPGFDEQRFIDAVKASNRGIFIGQTSKGGYHAVAYDGMTGQVFDPKGKVYPVEQLMNEGLEAIFHFFRIDRIQQSGSKGLEYPI